MASENWLECTPEQITSWVNRYFPNNKPRKNGTQLRICNPFNGDTGFHFEISVLTSKCHDWRGDDWVGFNAKGIRNKCMFTRFVQLYLTKLHGKCTFSQVVKDVTGSNKWSRSRGVYSDKIVEEEKISDYPTILLPVGSTRLSSNTSELAKGLKLWLLSRGVDDDAIVKYDMHSCGLNIVWPYYEFDELVYWQSRSRINKVFMYPSADCGVTKGQFIYGFDLISPASHLVLTEAIFCCQTLADQTGAIGGADITSDQIKKIRLLGPKDGIILASDNDAAGIKSIISNSEKLKSLNYKLYFSVPPSIEYTDSDGGKAFTKDWNDILRYTKEDPVKHFNENIKELTIRSRIDLHALEKKLSDKSIKYAY